MICNGNEISTVNFNGGGVQNWVHNDQTVYKSIVTFTVINNGTTTTKTFNCGDTVNLRTEFPQKYFSGYSFDGYTASDNAEDGLVTSVKAMTDMTFRCVYHRTSASGTWNVYYAGNDTFKITNFEEEVFKDATSYIIVNGSSQSSSYLNIIDPAGFGKVVPSMRQSLGKCIESVTVCVYLPSGGSLSLTFGAEGFSTDKRFK